MKAAIVLGATSMLGREITRQLSSEGIEVYSAGRQADVDISVNLGSDQAVDFHRSCEVDVLFHCASAFGGDDVEGLCENFRVNVGGCVSALEIASKARVKKIVYAGSTFSDPSSDSNPMGSYGFSKAEAERILDWGIARLGGEFCSLRLTQLWDTEGLCCVHQPWFGRIVAYASQGLQLNMPMSNGVRNFMCVSDAARLLILAAKNQVTGVHPVTHPMDVDLLELARSAYEIFGEGGGVVIDPDKAAFRQMAFPKEEGIFARLSFQPTLTPIQGIERIRDSGTASRFGPMDVQ